MNQNHNQKKRPIKTSQKQPINTKSMLPNHEIYASLLLGALLIATNLKPILDFREWINFKINSTFKQYKNERKNKTNHKS